MWRKKKSLFFLSIDARIRGSWSSTCDWAHLDTYKYQFLLKWRWKGASATIWDEYYHSTFRTDHVWKGLKAKLSKYCHTRVSIQSTFLTPCVRTASPTLSAAKLHSCKCKNNVFFLIAWSKLVTFISAETCAPSIVSVTAGLQNYRTHSQGKGHLHMCTSLVLNTQPWSIPLCWFGYPKPPFLSHLYENTSIN